VGVDDNNNNVTTRTTTITVLRPFVQDYLGVVKS